MICPQCNGRKVVFDPISLLLTVALPIALIIECDDTEKDNSITKRICPTCEGNGYLNI